MVPAREKVVVRIAIRVDSSTRIGSGHVMRCLALAAAVRERGGEVIFVCRELDGNQFALIESSGFSLVRLPSAPTPSVGNRYSSHAEWLGVSQDTDAAETRNGLLAFDALDWIVVDHYALDAEWERAARSIARRVMVIDDLANRPHDCDLLLDQNLRDRQHHGYAGLLPKDCKTLLGPKYALLRREFSANRAKVAAGKGELSRAMVFFGASDLPDLTKRSLEAFRVAAPQELKIDVVLGLSNPHFDQVASYCERFPNISVHTNVPDMANLMAAADIAIGAGGGSLWERCCLGVPSIVVSIADNQRSGSAAAAAAGAVLYLGDETSVDAGLIAAAIRIVNASPKLLASMRAAGRRMVDGRGVDRVVAQLFAERLALHKARPEDARAVYQWRFAEETREYSGAADTVPYENHLLWYAGALKDERRALLIGEIAGVPVGVLRYDRDADRATVSVYLVPGSNGLGLGPLLLESGTRWIHEHWPEVRNIDAYIHPGNVGSLAAFGKAGYKQQQTHFVKSIQKT